MAQSLLMIGIEPLFNRLGVSQDNETFSRRRLCDSLGDLGQLQAMV